MSLTGAINIDNHFKCMKNIVNMIFNQTYDTFRRDIDIGLIRFSGSINFYI